MRQGIGVFRKILPLISPETESSLRIMFHTAKAVSYTHLDVYKRQAWQPTLVPGQIKLKNLYDTGTSPNVLAVSYTHLDVYKRQIEKRWRDSSAG